MSDGRAPSHATGRSSHPAAPRYLPERALPSAAYVPGRSARPIPSHATPEAFDPAAWERSSSYVWGFDLLNHGYPWEAHEAWETSWRSIDRTSPEGLLLQALIKIAAAHVKRLQGQPHSASRHAVRAGELLSQVARSIGPERLLMGVDLEKVADAARHLVSEGTDSRGPGAVFSGTGPWGTGSSRSASRTRAALHIELFGLL